MKILIVEGEASTKLGGAEMSMFSFVNYLNQQGEEVYLSYQIEGDWLKGTNLELFTDTININISSFRIQGVLSYFRALNKFNTFCKKNNIDLILTHTIHGFLFLRLSKLFINTKIVCYFKWAYSKKSIGFLNKWGVRCIDLAVSLPAISDYWKINGVAPKYGFFKLYNGIKCNFQKDKNESEESELKKIVFFGRITESKGVFLLVKAVQELGDMKVDFYGKFNPKGNKFHKALQDFIQQNNLNERVCFPGFVDEPMETMRHYDLVVVPSLTFEAQGRVLFEAMCSETLVIASKIGGMPEILGKYSDQLTFEPDLENLLSCIQSIVSMNPLKRKVVKTYLKERFISNYTEKTTQKSLLKLLTNLHKNPKAIELGLLQ